jgi:hypothetical protein
LFGASGLAAWIRGRWRDASDRPLCLSLGWRRVAAIVAAAVVLPLVIYLIYARVTPLSGRGWGLNVQMRRVSLEYTILGATILMLLSYLARRGVRARAAELGLPLPPRGFRVRPLYKTLIGGAATLLALVCLAAVVTILFGSGLNFPRAKKMYPLAAVVLLVTCWLLVGVAVLMLRGGRLQDRQLRFFFAATVARTAFPILLVAAVVLAIAGLPLHWAESRAVAQAMGRQSSRLLLDETEAPELRVLRDQLRAEQERLLREEVPGTPR